jgi:hypothetical protein
MTRSGGLDPKPRRNVTLRAAHLDHLFGENIESGWIAVSPSENLESARDAREHRGVVENAGPVMKATALRVLLRDS